MKKLALLLTVAALLASCAKSDDPVKRREAATAKLLQKEKKIKIAVAGPWAQKRNQLFEGLELARDQLNESGGILGADIELVPFDDSNSAESDATAYQIASDEQICAVIGHVRSSVSISNSLIYHYYGLLMFSPLATSRKLTKQGLPFVFRNIPSNDTIGMRAAEFCAQMGWKRVMIYYMNRDYGNGLANAFELECGENGIFVPDRASYESIDDALSYSEICGAWKKNYMFDAVFVSGQLPQAGEAVSIFRANGITQPIVGGDTFDTPDFFAIAGNSQEENLYCVSNFNQDSRNAAFLSFKNSFRERFKTEPDQGALQGYDALKTLAKAMESAKSLRAADIAAALRAAEEWNEAAGPYRFDQDGDITGRAPIVKKASGGAFKPAE